MAGFQNDRFVIFLKNKSHYDESFEGEALLDESTGEFLVNTEAGDMLSYDFFKRKNQNYNNIEKSVQDFGCQGELFDIQGSTIQFPYIWGTEQSHTQQTLIDKDVDGVLSITGQIRRVGFAVDADAILVDPYDDSHSITTPDYDVEVVYNIYNLGLLSHTTTIVMHGADINPIQIPKGYNATKIEIVSIKIIATTQPTVPTRLIVHSATLFIDYTKQTGLIGIQVHTPPDKTIYYSGEELNLTGMIVHAYYGDGSFEPVTDYTIRGWADRPPSRTIVPITVDYMGKTDEFIVECPDAGFLYSVDPETNEATVERYIGDSSTARIPRILGGATVTAIGASTFMYMNVTNVIIPDTVVEIQ